MEFDLSHTPEAMELTTETLDLKENSLYLKVRSKERKSVFLWTIIGIQSMLWTTGPELSYILQKKFQQFRNRSEIHPYLFFGISLLLCLAVFSKNSSQTWLKVEGCIMENTFKRSWIVFMHMICLERKEKIIAYYYASNCRVGGRVLKILSLSYIFPSNPFFEIWRWGIQ